MHHCVLAFSVRSERDYRFQDILLMKTANLLSDPQFRIEYSREFIGSWLNVNFLLRFY